MAGTTAVAAAPVSMNAPVGIAAVAFGVVGLVTGLVRRRRSAAEPVTTGPNALRTDLAPTAEPAAVAGAVPAGLPATVPQLPN